MKSKTYRPSFNDPVWLEEGHRINEAVFLRDLYVHP